MCHQVAVWICCCTSFVVRVASNLCSDRSTCDVAQPAALSRGATPDSTYHLFLQDSLCVFPSSISGITRWRVSNRPGSAAHTTGRTTWISKRGHHNSVGYVHLTMQVCQSQHVPSMRQLQHGGDSCSTHFTQFSPATICHTLAWMHSCTWGGGVSVRGAASPTPMGEQQRWPAECSPLGHEGRGLNINPPHPFLSISSQEFTLPVTCCVLNLGAVTHPAEEEKSEIMEEQPARRKSFHS